MSAENQDGYVKVDIANHVAIIEFGHIAGNSFPSSLLNTLTTTLLEISRIEEVVVIVLKSQGDRVFCSGASFEEMLIIENEVQGVDFFSGFAHLLNAMRNCSKIIIGCIQGKSVGGGVGIIAACDYAIATSESEVKLSELAIGIGPFVIEPAISRKIGKAAMTELTLRASDWHSAQWSLDNKLFAKVCAADTLNEEVFALANQLANYSAEALLQLKKIIWEGTENWESLLFERAAISGKLVVSDVAQKCLLQFRNKK